jgi:uncharacterized membrane protein YfcA
LGAEALVLLVALGLALRVSGTSVGSAVGSVALQVLVPTIPGCLAGAAFGVWLSRTMGWRRPLVAGVLIGALLAGITMAVI